MMQEMYEWYMEHMFGIHEKKARSYRTKQNRKASRRRDSMAVRTTENFVFSLDDVNQRLADARYVMWKKPGRSKWERIGAPLVANTFDMAVILNPFVSHRMRAAALGRQIDEFMYRYDLSYNQ